MRIDVKRPINHLTTSPPNHPTMHVLFVHQNYPAQFGHIARHLVRAHGFECTFVSLGGPGEQDGVRLLQYRPVGGAHARSHYCSRNFENSVAHCHGVYDACRAHPDLRPDLIVGHSGFGWTLFQAASSEIVRGSGD